MQFDTPENAYWLLGAIIAIVAIEWLVKRNNAIPVSSTLLFAALPATLKSKLTWLPRALLYLALSLLGVALLTPYIINEKTDAFRQGIAVVIALDASSSMKFTFDTEQRTRLDVAKSAINTFIADQTVQDSDQRNLIALVSFAKYTYLESPLTDSYNALMHLVNRVETPEMNELDGTGFGDAIAFSSAMLNTFEENSEKSRQNQHADNEKIKNKVLILLTDGENNTGTYSPQQAMALAQQWGIKVYSIFISSNTNEQGAPSEVEWTLNALSQSTGGLFQHVTSAASLDEVYAQIRTLETSDISNRLITTQHFIHHYFILASLLFSLAAFITHSLWLRIL